MKAIKIEEWEGQFGNVDVETDVAVIEKARSIIGPKRDLMIDVQNRWRDVGQALRTIDAIEQYTRFSLRHRYQPTISRATESLSNRPMCA